MSMEIPRWVKIAGFSTAAAIGSTLVVCEFGINIAKGTQPVREAKNKIRNPDGYGVGRQLVACVYTPSENMTDTAVVVTLNNGEPNSDLKYDVHKLPGSPPSFTISNPEFCVSALYNKAPNLEPVYFTQTEG